MTNMKKDYMKPEAEKIIFLTEEDLMTSGNLESFPNPEIGWEPWDLR